MAETRSEYVELLLSRYADTVSRDEQDDLIGLSEEPEEEGVEDEMLAFLQDNPEASLQDVMQFLFSICNLTPLEIVDDDDVSYED